MRIISENAYLTDEELVAKYKKLAPTADRRIARIEAKMGQAKYKGIEKWAYTEAKRKLENIIGLSGGKPRFNRSIKNLSRGQKELMVGHVEHFLASKTSSLREYDKSWKQGLTHFNKNNKMNLTMAEYRELWESEEFRKLVEEFGSDEAITEFNTLFDGDVSMTDAIHAAVINKKLKSFASDFNKYVESQKAAGKPINLLDRVISLEELEDKLKAEIGQGKKSKVIDLRGMTADEFTEWLNKNPKAFKYNIHGIERKIK